MNKVPLTLLFQALFVVCLHATIGNRIREYAARLEQSQNQIPKKDRSTKWDSQ